MCVYVDIHIYIFIYIYIYIHIYEKHFTKAQPLKLELTLQAHFLEWRLARFGKELVI